MLQFPVGSLLGTELCFDVTLESDNLVEGFENFTVIITPLGTLLSTIPGRDRAEVVITGEYLCTQVLFTVAQFPVSTTFKLEMVSALSKDDFSFANYKSAIRVLCICMEVGEVMLS